MIVPLGQSLAFQVSPAAGMTFEVDGANCDANGACVVAPPERASEVVVRFLSDAVTLRLSITGLGQVESEGLLCRQDGGTCGRSYSRGSRVQLRASGAEFASDASVRWSTGCAGSTCEVALVASRDVAVQIDNFVTLEVQGADGGLEVDGALRALPFVREVPIGSAVRLVASPGPDDTFGGFSGLPCAEPVAEWQCSLQLDRSASGRVRFHRFIERVIDWEGIVGSQSQMLDLLPTRDGGVLGALSFDGTTNLVQPPATAGVFPAGPASTLLFEWSHGSNPRLLSQSSGSELGPARFFVIGDRVMLGGAPNRAGNGATFVVWGAVDAGAPTRSGQDFVMLEFDSSGLPVDHAWVRAGLNEGSFEPLAGDLVPLDGGFGVFVGLSGPFSSLFPTASGFLTSSAFIAFDGGLGGIVTPSLWTATSMGPVVSQGQTWVSTFSPSAPCPAPPGAVALGLFDPQRLTCGTTVPIVGEPGRSLPLSDSFVVPSSGLDGGTKVLDLRKLTPAGALSWRWAASSEQASLPSNAALVRSEESLVAVWRVGGGDWRDVDGVRMKCPSTVGQHLLITRHRILDGQLLWAHCLDGTPQLGVQPFTRTQPAFAATPQGVLLVQEVRGPGVTFSVKVGSATVRAKQGERDYLLELVWPPLHP
ncbi:MAG: hypothetical protein GQE15_36240 [Archangiaceae bacterium]|nr:hypothetical protein [Archangiaceae bacterium]